MNLLISEQYYFTTKRTACKVPISIFSISFDFYTYIQIIIVYANVKIINNIYAGNKNRTNLA